MKESGNGKRVKKDGKKLRSSTVDNYIYTYKLLERFCNDTQFDLHFTIVSKARKRDFEVAKKYWKKFYTDFTHYLYKDLDYYDNYVGLVIKSLRTFFNYVKEEKNIDIGAFHKTFYVPKEDVAIIALSPEQVNYLIKNEELNQVMPQHLHRIRDMFVFGCAVCLRVSDLLAIKPQNIAIENGGHYLRINSLKTGTFTSIKLPAFAIDIVNKYTALKGPTLFPSISKDRFNAALKDMGKYLNYSQPMIKTRTKRGVECVVYKNKAKKQHYTLGDMITTHTMRRTGITTLLRMGIPDYVVRKISGHSANSKEFFRYVQLAQNYVDKHTDDAFEKLNNLV